MVPFFYVFYRFGRSVWGSLKDPEFEALFSLVLVVLGVGTVFYHYNENWTWLDSLFFSVTTLTTVGYGNLVPHTDAGKIFTIFYLFVGIGILLSFITYVADRSIAERKTKSILPWRRNPSSESSAS